jgi:Fungal specific transcription factor domain
MVLSSVVALMELVQNKGKQSATTLSKAVMRHATEAISQLQVKLVCEKDSLDDAVLIAMLNLAAMEFHENNFGRLNIHMQAITRIVELRGGVDRLGFDGYLGHTILAYTTLWQQMRLYHLHPPKVTIEYPSHPFSPEFCKHISDLPVGFQEPMLARQCCVTVIEILHNIFVSKIQEVVTVAIPYETLGESIIEIRYLQQRPELSVFERIILHGIIAFIIHSDNSKAMYRVLKPKFLQVQCQALLTQNKDLTAMHESQRQCLIWASCLFIAETQWGSWTSRLGTKLLANVADDMSWEKRLELCQDFFWNAGCTTELQWKIKHEGER